MRIGIIHATLNAVEPISAAFRELVPDVEIVNFINEELLAHANKHSGVDYWGIKHFVDTAKLALDSELDGIMIACTLYCPYVQLISQMTDLPVVAVDAPMISKAVSCGKKIGILATTAASGPSAAEKLMTEAVAKGITVEYEIGISVDAMKALKHGDAEMHDNLLLNEADALAAKGCEIMLLSQITMARAQACLETQGYTVLSSPIEGAKALIRMVGGKNE